MNNNKISVKIDVTRIRKESVFVGKKGKYLNITLVPKVDEYGNHYMVVQDGTKEDRDNKVELPILGNAKILGTVKSVQSEENDDIAY